MSIRYTGLGYLSLILSFVIIAAGFWGGAILAGNEGSFPTILLVAAGLSVLLAPLHWPFGWVLNSERTPSGRQWHNRHTCAELPVQYWFIIQLVFALVFASIALGQLTSPLYGWLLCSGVLAVALVGYGLIDRLLNKGSFLNDVGCLIVICVSVALILGLVVLVRLAAV